MTDKLTYEKLQQRVKELESAEAERQRLEEALRESESALNNFIDYTQEIIGIIEQLDEKNDLRCIRINKTAGQYIKRSPETLRGMFASQIGISEEIRRQWIEQCRKSERLDMPVEFECHREFPDGIRTMLATVSLIKSPRFVFIIRDITEPKKIRDTLNRIVELAPDMIGTINVKEGYFKQVNKAWEEILGYPRAELLSRPYMDFIHPDDQDAARHAEKRLISGRTLVKFENRYICKDGTIKNIEWHTTEAQADGTIYAVARDITENKKIQIQLQQSQKMEAIGTLAGGIAHDFNNILAVILGYADLAKDDAPPGSQYLNDLEEIMAASYRAKDLVSQILTFSRKTEIKHIPLQLQSLVKEAIKMLRASIPTTIDIQDAIDSQCGFVLADPTQIHQIIMNLCTNANHAMEQSGGILKIELKSLYINKDHRRETLDIKPGEYVELTIADTGIGIDPDVIYKIFDPYFTTKEPGRGTGMGLAIIHRIVTDYGGTITVESELGKGTTFHVYFPVIEKEALPPVEKIEKIPHGNESILFVDDEELLTRMSQNILERLGYRVTVRRSSLDALSTFQNAPGDFDLVITDQTMPGMTGSDLARRMKQIRPDVPIILCTGYSNLINELSAKDIGIKEFALKPLTKGALAKLIRKVLDS